MKHVIRLIWLILPALMLSGCSEDESALQKEKIQFSFDFTQLTDDGGRVASANEIPAGTRLLVSITTSTDSPVLTFEEIELLRLGDALISTPIELTPGNYKVTDFMFVNDSDEILFATPRKNSTMAKYVASPLDVNFSASANAIKNIKMEVMDVSSSTPADFGYASFNVNVVHPLHLGVFITGESGINLTPATAYILKNNVVLQQFNLGARINALSFKQDPAATYTLKIVKKGYGMVYKQFVYNDVIEELNGSPWTFTLTPAFSMLAYTNIEQEEDFEISLNGLSGNLTVDWGDGTIEQLAILEVDAFSHRYPVSGHYAINVTGDLDKITDFKSFYGMGVIEEIDTYHLTELLDFRIGLTQSPRIVDLSRCTKLIAISMPMAQQLEKVTIPMSPSLDYVWVSGTNKMTTATISDLITALHHNVVTNEVHGGYFGLAKRFEGENSDLIIGPPSAASLELLTQMRDEYGWTISPDF